MPEQGPLPASPLAQEIAAALNRVAREGVSNTPDFILAEYLLACLAAFEAASVRREHWYGHTHQPGEPHSDDSLELKA